MTCVHLWFQTVYVIKPLKYIPQAQMSPSQAKGVKAIICIFKIKKTLG